MYHRLEFPFDLLTDMSNSTDDYINTDVDWGTRSPVLNYPSSSLPTIYFSIALGFGMVIHSWYLNRWKWTMVRIVSELASLSLAGAAICFLQCIDSSCPVFDQAVIYNAVANCVFGLIAQTADNYLTFQRFQVVIGKVSTTHKVIAFNWYLFLLVFSWWPFYSILPVWFDMNGALWANISFICGGYLNFSAYIVFNLYHEIQVYAAILSYRRNTTTGGPKKDFLVEIAVRAILHTTCSIVGIFLYSFNLPDGVLEQIIMEAGGIHFFLNWKSIKFTAVWSKLWKMGQRRRPTLQRVSPIGTGGGSRASGPLPSSDPIFVT